MKKKSRKIFNFEIVGENLKDKEIIELVKNKEN